MHLLILGATGRTGVYGYKYALEQGYHVTVLTRPDSSVPPQENLTVVEGSVMSETDMERAMTAAGVPVDATLHFLNPHRASDSPWAKFLGPPRLMAEAAALAARGLRRQQQQRPGAHKPRMVVLNAIGAGQSRAVLPWCARVFFDYTNISYTYKDHAAVDSEIEGNCQDDVRWTVAYAVGLSDEGAVPVKTFGLKETGFSFHITRESLARWMVDVAAGESKGDFDNRRVIVSN
uniref:NAD(P)-binding domain-containing protein n=2 Tax=Bionectria ochroleuca TaxID=29856 RepID=A0A8H7MZ20_BIOOC